MATTDEIIELYIQDDPVLAVTQIYNTLRIGPNRLYAVLRENGIELRRDKGITSRSQDGSVMGQYDEIVVSEAPDDETVAKLALSIGSAGAIRTETFRAFTEDEYRKVIAALP